ncbi:MAG: phosphatase PAP2 family protein [Bacteroidia bacterium]
MLIEILDSWDKKLLIFLAPFHHAALDPIVVWATKSWVWAPLFGYILWQLYKQVGKKSLLYLAGGLLCVITTDVTSARIIKPLFKRLRPCHQQALQAHIYVVPHTCGGKYGFVSSHAANSFGLATFLSLTPLHIGGKILILSWAVVHSYTRVYLGVHFVGDILGGAVWGCLLAIIIARLMQSYGSR